MNFAQFKIRAAYLAQQAGAQAATPAPDWGALVNTGLGDFSWDTEYNTETVTFTSVALLQKYVLPQPYFREIKQVVWGITNPLYRTSEIDEFKQDPLWMFRAATSIPFAYAVTGPDVILLVDTPSSSGTVVSVSGTRQAPALVADTDVALFPDTYGEAVAIKAALYHCEAFMKSDADVALIASWRGQYAAMVRACKDFMSGSRHYRMQRTVSAPSRPRAYTRLPGRVI